MNFLPVKTSRKWASFRVGYLLPSGRPYPLDCRTAFAFSGFFYPLRRPPSLRLGDRVNAGRMGLTQWATDEIRTSEVGACPPTVQYTLDCAVGRRMSSLAH